jgi:hypothetical protein
MEDENAKRSMPDPLEYDTSKDILDLAGRWRPPHSQAGIAKPSARRSRWPSGGSA